MHTWSIITVLLIIENCNKFFSKNQHLRQIILKPQHIRMIEQTLLNIFNNISKTK